MKFSVGVLEFRVVMVMMVMMMMMMMMTIVMMAMATLARTRMIWEAFWDMP